MAKPNLSAARAVLAGSLVQNKARSALSVLAIALGVALGYAVSLITGAAVNELALGVQFLSGDADLQVRGPRGGFDRSGLSGSWPGCPRWPWRVPWSRRMPSSAIATTC